MTKKKIILKKYNIFLFIFIFLFSISFTYAPLTPLTFNDPVDENFISPTPFYTFNFSYSGTQDSSIFLDFDNTVLTYLNFENVSGTTVFDSSTYGRNATLVGGASIDSTNSIRGDNVNINGNHRVDLAPISTPLTDFTVSFWFRSNTAIPSSNNPNFVLYETDSIDIYFIQTNNGRILFQQGASNFLTNRNSWSAGTWYHIVYTYNTTDNNLSVYVNGDLDNSVIRAGVNIDASSTHNFGRQLFGTQYRGRLDEFLLMNRTINPSEVLGLYDANSGDVNAYVGNLDDRVYEYRACVIEDNGDFSCTQDRTFEVFDGPIPVEVFFENSFTNQQTADISVVSMLAQNVQFSCDNSSWSDIYVFEDFRVNSTTAVIPLEITNSSIGCDINEGVRTIFVNATGFFDPGFNSTTITYDITPPSIFDVTPLNGSVISTSITNFQFQVNDTLSPINNCILFIDGFQDGDIEFSIPQDTPFTFSRNSTDIGLGNREFAISCQDEAGNSQVIQPREFLMAVEAPDIQNLTFSTQRAGFGEEVVIELIVPEPFGGYDTVFFEITPQSGAPFTITPTLISSDTFRHIYTQTWEEGVVNVYAFVNTTGGLFDEIESNFTINSSLQASIFTSRDSYLQGEIIDLTSSFSWFDTSWNYRFLNILEPQQIFRNSVIFNERINFSQKLEQRNEFGNININSIRIIEYDSSGSPIMFDSTRIGDERFFIDYEVSGDESSQYDGVTNAVLDIAFALEDEIEINQERYFMIYFDVEENGPKPTSSSQIDNIVFPISCNNPFVKTTDDTGAHYFIPINDDGTFGNEEFLFSNGDRIRGEAIADFSGDGNCDFLYFSNTQNRFFGVRQTDEYVFSQPFDLNITSPSPSMSGWQMDMAVGDFTNNYFQDVITSGNNGRLYILENSGNFDFSARLITTSTPGGAGRCKDSGDLNNNGILDFIYGSTSDNGNIYAYFGNGDGTFQEPVLVASALTGNNDMYGCALGHFNDDNYLDLAVIGGNSGDTYLFTSDDGSGTSFTNQGIIFDLTSHAGIGSYDINKDGFDDVIIIRSGGGVRYYQNNQDNSFTQIGGDLNSLGGFGMSLPERFLGFEEGIVGGAQRNSEVGGNTLIFNSGTTTSNVFVNVYVEYFNESISTWELVETIIEDTTPRELISENLIDIQNLYNQAGAFNTSTNPLGEYRVVLELQDNIGNTLIVDSSPLITSYEFTLDIDTTPPFIDNIIVDPQIGGFDNEILLQAFVTDISDSIDNVWVDITYPDSSTQRVDLIPVTDIIYRGFFNDTWTDGLYLVNFFANDTNGNLNNTIPTRSFTIESNVSMSLATLQSEYLNAEIVELSSPFEWWDNNWNYRRLLIVDESDTLRIEPLISLDIDFTQELLQFNSLNEFDINSIRIIEYRGDGTLLEFDNTLSGNERFIVPRQVTPNTGFNNLSNADVNIEFNVPGITQPDEVRFFMIYFDDNELGTKSEQIQTQVTQRAPQCLNPFVKLGDDTGRHFIARINQETGTVENVVQELFDGRRLRGGAVADFTGNGLCDFTYTEVDERVQYIVEQTGNYQFTDPIPIRSVPNMNTYEMGSAAGDFTGNGLIDIIIGGNNRNIYLLENNGNFNFGISTITTTAPGNQGRCKDSGDLNGNGILDFIYGGNSDDGNIYAYFGNGDGTFQEPALIASVSVGNNDMYGCAVGYFTDNNFLDVAVVGGNSGDTFLFTNDDGTATSFTNQGVIISSTNHRSIDAFDVNNNGFDDIIATRWTSNQNRVYLNNGDGSFTFDRQFGTVRSLGLSAPSYALIDTTFTLEPSEVNLFQEIPSFVFNNGNSSFNYFLNISVEYFNETTSSWQLVEEKVDSSIKRTLNLGGLINLRSLFAEAGNFDTTNQEAGQYRVFVRLTDNEQNVLSNGPNVFEISALFNITPDTIAPELFEMNINPNPANVTEQVNLSARAIDNFEVFRVWANVTSPSNTIYEINLSLDSLTFYSELFNETSEIGEYLVQFFAIDFDNNINESEIFELLVLDNIVPNISFVVPTPEEQEEVTSADGVVINVTSSDNSGISSTFIDFNRSILAYYNFENPIPSFILDNSSYENVLFETNTNIALDRDSIRGNYLEINPTSNVFIINNDSVNTNLEKITLSAFINLNSTDDMNIIGKFSGEYGLQVRGGNIQGFFENSSNIVSHPISSNEWNLVTLTYNSSHVSLYINATLVDELEIGETTSGVGGEFRIGDNSMPANNFKIDEILLHNRAITQNEIESLYNSAPSLEVEYTQLNNGNYTVIASIIDIGGNINITTRTFEMNITDPLITILSPIDETKYLSNEELNLTIQSDQELQNVYYIINGNESNQIALNSGDLFNWTNKLNFTLGFNTITLRYTSTINRNFERDIIIYIIEAVSKDMVRVIHANSNSDIEFNINSNSELNSTVFVEIDFNYPLNSTRTSDFNFTRNFNDINSTIFGFILNESPTTLNISQFENQALRVNNIFGLG